jgi:hypothetical protein
MRSKSFLLLLPAFFMVLSVIPSMADGADQSAKKKGKAPTVHTVDNDPSDGTPEIYLPEPEHNFGTVPQKSKLTHVFKVVNKGDGPLKIIKVSAS